MRFKRPIYRILFYTAWLVVIGSIVTLLIAANSKAKARTCQGIVVSINNGGDRIYVEKDDVLKNIEQTANGPLINRHTGELNLSALEKGLEKDPWIRDAELYFNAKDMLHVAVSERVPVARVFNMAGASFYIDSSGAQMPLLERYSAKLPVVTGFVSARHMTNADSILLQETKRVVKAISSDAFWNAQIGQIDITPERTFELIPVVGSGVIKLGSGDGVEEKLAKLMVFYQQVLPQAGLAKYSVLDVRFDGQVVAVRRGSTSAVDSIQLQKNITQLMERKMAEQEPDDDAPVTETTQTKSGDVEEPTTLDETMIANSSVATAAPKPDLVAASVPGQKTTVQKPVVKKTATSSKLVQKQMAEKKVPVTKPKAVMAKKAANEY